MICTAIFIVNMVACLAVVFTGLFLAINNMSKCTDHVIRIAWICITTGAFGVLAGAMYGHTHSTVADTIINVGVAIFAIADRRRYRRDASAAQRRADRAQKA